MNWSPADFVVFGAMLGALAGGLALAFRHAPNARYRAAAAVALLAAVLLFWVNGAVGIIGGENDDANLVFVGVLGLAAVGAALSRFRPLGMFRAMAVTALAQLVVGVVAVAGGLGTGGARWPADLIAATAFFTALWLLSGWLFRRSAVLGDPVVRA